ncbi:alanine racemase [uncultured Gemmiger sp.]|uniref:alanine racemase n=1 Tax=uncultured Gemmiger sp. TaxID=1623490 RepID=UPI0025ECDC87|nr:alanine racemase [uncultured Gemmiger sp.]
MRFEKHCWAEIDLDALLKNYHFIRKNAGGDVCAVLKADAYGHGSLAVADALRRAGVAACAVSCLAEARELRRHGVDGPVLILGYTDPAFADELAGLNITQTLFSTGYARALSAAASAAGCTVRCHLKADTGMGRIGFALRTDFGAAVAEMEACYALPGIRITGVFQHFAVADSLEEGDAAYTENQHVLFARLVDRLRADGFDPGVTHCANSAAQLTHPQWRCDLVRAGIILYGLSPSGQVGSPELCPVMSLKAVVTFVKELLPGQSVSYGRTFTASRPMRVATISVGYADGYPRKLSDLGTMTIRGQAAPVLGRVCMDQTIVDVTGIPGVQPGDEVLVFGPGAAPGADTTDTVAEKAGTINYEIVCGISRRVPRVYLQNGEAVRIWNDLEEG